MTFFYNNHNTRRSFTLTFLFIILIAKTQAFLSGTNTNNNDMIASQSRRAFFQSHHIYKSSNTFTNIFASADPDLTNDELEQASASIKTNEYFAQQRLAIESGKRQSRKDKLEEDKQRNLRLKRLFSTEAYASSTDDDNDSISETGYPIPKMYQIRISVDQEIRQELKMNGREKRGRVFIQNDSEGCASLKGLKFEIHAFFRALKKSTYLLSANLPTVLEDGSIFSPGDEKDQVEGVDPYQEFWDVENDEDVKRIFERADEFFQSYNDGLDEEVGEGDDDGLSRRLKRPSVLIHVRKDPNALPPPPPPAYLDNMVNPMETETMTMLSFYSFPPGGVKDPEEFALFLRKVWKPFDALGRVYVAEEGINAQMSIPTNV